MLAHKRQQVVAQLSEARAKWQQLLSRLRLLGRPRADKGPQAATAELAATGAVAAVAADESATAVDGSVVEGGKAAVALVLPEWPGKWPHAPKAMVLGSPGPPPGAEILFGSPGPPGEEGLARAA